MIERLEGRTFRTFLAVVEEKSFSRAAERLGYVQSTVTTQIRLLEETAGKKLFDRLARGVEPTEAGIKLASYARRFLELGEALAEELREDGEPAGTVRLRVLESFGAGYLWGPLEPFLRRYPRIETRVDTGFQADTVEAVRCREVELGIVPGDPGRGDLRFEPLLRDELVWAAAPQAAPEIDAAGYAGLHMQRLIGFGSRCMYTAEAEAMLLRHGATVRGRAEFASLDMIKQALRSGWGIAFLPRSSMRAELARGELAECPSLGEQALCHGLVSSKQRELSRAAALLRRALLDSFAGVRP